MKKFKEYIKEEIAKGDTMVCTLCGREVEVTKKGSGPLICCMKEMVKK